MSTIAIVAVLMRAARAYAFQMLAKAGVSAELKTRSGQTALDVAHEMGHDDLVALYHSSKAYEALSVQ